MSCRAPSPSVCERCDDPALRWRGWEALTAEEVHRPEPNGPLTCEYENDLYGPPAPHPDDPRLAERCPNPAAWVLLDSGPLDHLCEAHKEKREAQLLAEDGVVVGPVGIDDVDRFLPIEADEPCEAIDEETMRDCGKDAGWVEVATYEFLACKAHREREGRRA